MLISKVAAEKIYSIWCCGEDSRFEYKNDLFGLEEDDEDDVCYVNDEGEWVKLITLEEDYVTVSVVERVYTLDNSWKA